MRNLSITMTLSLTVVSALLFSTIAFSNDFFDIETVNVIEIEFDTPFWDEILDSLFEAGEGGRLIGNAYINGEPFDSVGVRYKGYSTFDPDHVKNPFNVKLDYVINNQSLDGVVTLKLSNGISDPTFLREVMGYEIARQYMPASLANYINVYVNGALIGLYVNDQSIDDYFCENHFLLSNGPIFKGEVDSTHYLNKVWLYYGPSSTAYANLYEMKSDYGWEELIHFLDVFNNTPSEMEDVLDVDRHLWFLVFQNLIIHLDSPYVWARNYYVCQDINNRFNSVIWDLNMAFGVFNVIFGMGYLELEDMQTLDPFLHSDHSNYAMMFNIFNDSTYRNMYIAHMKTMIQENFLDDEFLDRALEIQDIINESVLADTNKYYSYEDFIRNVTSSTGFGIANTPGLTELMDGRVEYLLNSREFLELPPVISDFTYSPAVIEPISTVWFQAEVDVGANVILGYRLDSISKFTKTEMFDDGLHNDGEADDGIYGVSIISGYSELQYFLYCENEEAGIFSPERAEFEYFSIPVSSGLYINEFMADNETTVTDPQNEYEDWIEIFNGSDSLISLSGYYLTDNLAERDKWAFPEISISPGEFLLVWADDDTGDAGLHANFKLNREGEEIGLYYALNEDILMVDQLEFGAQLEDTSYGRYPDGSDNWITLAPTPGWGNGLNEVQGDQPDIPRLFSLSQNYPNPFNNNTTMKLVLPSAGKVNIAIYNVNGREVVKLLDGFVPAGSQMITWNAEDVSSGLYFARLNYETESRTMKMLLLK